MDNNIDKWGSLSMPERASLISLFTGSGVTSLDEMRALYNEYGGGGSIHIDSSKKGTFTAAAKRRGMGVQEFASRVLSNKDDYSSAMVKKANFARNAAKWHANGGYLSNDANYAAYGLDINSNDNEVLPSFSMNFQLNSGDTDKNIMEIPFTGINNVTYDSENKIPDDLAQNDFISRVNKIVSEQNENLLNSSDKFVQEYLANKYNKNEVAQLQSEMYDLGLFDNGKIFLAGKEKAKDIQRFLIENQYMDNGDDDGIIGKKTSSAIQKYLKDNGYDVGEIDGIIGSKTRKALNQYNKKYFIDGIIGPKTVSSYKKFLVKKDGFDTPFEDNDDIDDCAKFVRKRYDQAVGETRVNGVNGNAWTMIGNILDHGGKSIYNIYDDKRMIDAKTPEEVSSATRKITGENKFNYKNASVGDIIGIYIPGSKHMQEAIDTGTTKNTHVGVVVGIDNGIPIIEHKVNGSIRKDKITNITGAKYGRPIVTAVVRPSISSGISGELDVNRVKSDINIKDDWKNEQINEYMDSLAGMKQLSNKLFDNVDSDFIEKASIAILGRETYFMNRKQSDVSKDFKHPSSMVMANLRKVAHKLSDKRFVSGDLTKFKFASLPEPYRKAIGLNDPDQLNNDPTTTAKAVYLYLARAYDFYKRYSDLNPHLGMTETDIENAVIDSYNKGIRFTGITRGYINKLRSESDYNNKIKDIKSTNYARVGQFGEMIMSPRLVNDPFLNSNMVGQGLSRLMSSSPKIAQGIANVAYKAFAKPSVSYVGAARKYMENIKAYGGNIGYFDSLGELIY